MSTEIEMAALAGSDDASPLHNHVADLQGEPCRNCSHPVTERFCAKCGQFAASFHRPIWSLVSDSLIDTFGLDGRLWRTLPLLMVRPGRLTQRYIAGRRARFVPPFRLFLTASVLFFFTLFATQVSTNWVPGGLDDAVEIETPVEAAPETAPDVVDPGPPVQLEFMGSLGEEDRAMVELIEARARYVLEKPEYFIALLQKWAPRLSLLLIPVTILSYVLLHAFNRRVYVYDHVIHALHLHTWAYLFGVILLLAAGFLGGWTLPVFSTLAFAYTWRSFSVAYGTGKWMSLIRTIFMVIIWVIFVGVSIGLSVLLSAIGV